MLTEFYNNYIYTPGGYTTTQTILFAIILVVAVFLIYKYIIKKLPIKIDNKFLITLIPFIVFGGLFRVLGPDDAGVFTGFFTHTPGIFFLIFFITLGSLLLAIGLQKVSSIEYDRWMYGFGTLSTIVTLYLLSGQSLVNIDGFFMIVGLTALTSLAMLPITYYKPQLLSKMNHLILTGHLLDGSSTFIATAFFGYTEKHVLPRFLIDIFGSWIMLPLKIGVVWYVLYSIDQMVEDEELLTWLRVVILVLGLALGIRNLTLVTLGI